jgi:hypothetical protein
VKWASIDGKDDTVEDTMNTDVRYRRKYDGVSSEDGIRILVDRIWPRGIRVAAHGGQSAQDHRLTGDEAHSITG